MMVYGFDGGPPPPLNAVPLPVGTIVVSAKDDLTIGNGYVWDGQEWLMCSGTLSQEQHPALYAAIADIFNNGDTPVGHFALPDLRARTIPASYTQGDDW